MRRFRECLRLPDSNDVRAAVLDDLSTYTGVPPDACVLRCLDWEDDSIREWFSADRSDAAGVNDFYRTTQSWLFDLLWYAYLQAEGFAYPTNTIALRLATAFGGGADHLDYGSGVGVTSQLFARAGYGTTLADVSDSLLAFARYRLERRDVPAEYVDLNVEPLGDARYDVITAIDTLVCIDDLDTVAGRLHTALRPGGCLVANLYPRPRSRDIAWAVHDDTARPRAVIERAGFLPAARSGNFIVFHRVDPSSAAHRVRMLIDELALTSPASQVLHRQQMRLSAALRRMNNQT
jgi:SAM-dependent methyltransferase